MEEARRRTFDASGKEVDTRPRGKEVIQRTGYLVANWKKTEAQGTLHPVPEEGARPASKIL